MNYLAEGDIDMEVHARQLGTPWGQGDSGQGSDRDLGVLLLCNATFRYKQKPCVTGGSQCTRVMTAQPIK